MKEKKKKKKKSPQPKKTNNLFAGFFGKLKCGVSSKIERPARKLGFSFGSQVNGSHIPASSLQRFSSPQSIQTYFLHFALTQPKKIYIS